MKKKSLLLILAMAMLFTTGCSTDTSNTYTDARDKLADDISSIEDGFEYLKHFINVIRGVEDEDIPEDSISETSEVLLEELADLGEDLTNAYYYVDEGEDFEAGEESLHAVTLLNVIDGDTIVVDDNGYQEKVRFIGMDTPESVNSDASKNNEYGTMASDYTKALLEEYEVVYLQYDEQTTDTYGRTLAYVWLSDDVDIYDIDDIGRYMLNAILIEDGYAYDKVYEPNHKYATIFEDMRITAQDEEAGLWQYEGFAKLWN